MVDIVIQKGFLQYFLCMADSFNVPKWEHKPIVRRVLLNLFFSVTTSYESLL